ncbi:MAG: EAL domain-containing response regulator [Pseudomonadales bacterium]|jgi:EAL domain-containing protein (putative c-di-GMP-specific phosphodiesterase class I)|nr:EAL domain-containing response regulator [Pseudomonadales bacterium]
MSVLVEPIRGAAQRRETSGSPLAKERLLIVDDEPSLCEFVGDVARASGYDSRSCADLDGVVKQLETFRPTLLLLDLKMPRQDGIEVLRALSRLGTKVPIVLVSGEGARILEAAERYGRNLGLPILGFLEKPIPLSQLETFLHRNSGEVLRLDEQEITRALDHEEFVPTFHPKITLCEDGAWRITGVEALVRWRHPRLGTLGADRFIAAAERTSVMSRLTETMLIQAMDAAAGWQTDWNLQLDISVNLPTSQLAEIDLPERILALCEARGISPERITLEVTERGTMLDRAKAADVLTRCRLKRFSVSMDDFGTGYSSLTHLVQLPFNELKIDRSFVARMDESESNRVIVRSCIALARSLGLSACAEGIETAAALERVELLGCTHAQGHWISPPASAQDIPSIARNFSYRRLS